MVERKTIGIVLLVLAAVIALSYTSLGSGLNLPGLPEPDGSQLECSLSVDSDSIHSAVCTVESSCRTSSFGVFGLFDTTRTLKFNVGGKTVRSQAIDLSVLGSNKDVSINACVKSSYSSGTFTLLDKEGVQKASKGGPW
jgi:hypothetical protein